MYLTGSTVTADGLLGERIVWVELSRSRLVGGQIVTAPKERGVDYTDVGGVCCMYTARILKYFEMTVGLKV